MIWLYLIILFIKKSLEILRAMQNTLDNQFSALISRSCLYIFAQISTIESAAVMKFGRAILNYQMKQGKSWNLMCYEYFPSWLRFSVIFRSFIYIYAQILANTKAVVMKFGIFILNYNVQLKTSWNFKCNAYLPFQLHFIIYLMKLSLHLCTDLYYWKCCRYQIWLGCT